MKDEFYYKDRLELARAIRKYFPAEWQPVVFRTPQPKKNSIEFQGFFVIDGTEIRLDWELAEESIADGSVTSDAQIKLMREFIDMEIEDGVVEEIKRKQNDK